jgi:putative ABC transport system permease protein
MKRLAMILKVGMQAIMRNKLRSALTMLGIIIGVGCVIAMIAIGSGASRSIQSQIESLGSNFIMIFPGASTQGGAHLFTDQSFLTEDDANAIKADCPSVAYVTPGVRTSAQVVSGETNWGTQIQGVGVEWPLVRTWNTVQGAFFSDSDVRAAAKVCVLGGTVNDNLFPAGNAVGQMVRIKNVPFKVSGVLEKKGGSMMGDQDDTVVVPYTTAMKRLTGKNRLNAIYVSAVSVGAVDQAQSEIDSLLRQRHHIGPNQDADFTMRSQQEFAAMSEQSSKTLSLLLASAAAISLLVGGIGIMNIMLVSVTERTREIGIRMAIGAKGAHVLLQFLIEAVTLAVFGGLIGIGLGIAASAFVSKKGGLPVNVSPASIVLAFGFSAAIGIFFGFYPARKASRLDPIEALRYE